MTQTTQLLEIIATETDRQATKETCLDTLGDSLDYLSLIVRIEEAFGVDIPKEALLGFETVGDIDHWLEANACD